MLTKKKKDYAEARKSGKNITESAIKAGYSPSTARQAGSRLEKDEDVMRYIAGKPEVVKVKPIPETPEDLHIPSHPKTSDPLKFFESVMNDHGEDMRLRLDAAKTYAAYTIAKPGEKGKKEVQADKAKEAAKKFSNLRAVK